MLLVLADIRLSCSYNVSSFQAQLQMLSWRDYRCFAAAVYLEALGFCCADAVLLLIKVYTSFNVFTKHENSYIRNSFTTRKKAIKVRRCINVYMTNMPVSLHILSS